MLLHVSLIFIIQDFQETFNKLASNAQNPLKNNISIIKFLYYAYYIFFRFNIVILCYIIKLFFIKITKRTLVKWM